MRLVKTIPHTGDFGRSAHFDQGCRCAVKRPLPGRLRGRYAQGPRALRIGGSNEEVRPLTVVPDEKSLTRLQPPIDVDDGNALSVRSRYDPVTGLENETAKLGHLAILRARRPSEYCPGPEFPGASFRA